MDIPIKIKDKHHGKKGAHEGEEAKSGAPATGSPTPPGVIAQGFQAPETGQKEPEKPGGGVPDKDARILELEEQVLRLSAEFENFRKRQERKYEEWSKYAAEGVICQFLPVLDNIRLTVENAEKDADSGHIKKGLEMITSQLQDTMKKLGVEEIDSLGKEFDPAMHHALAAEETSSIPDGQIVTEFQKGFIFNGKVIRPSMVKVARQPGITT